MLFKLLSAPVTAPLNTVTWIGKRLAEQAEEQLNDTEELKRQLVALEQKLEAGEMTEEEFEELELDLVMRLQAAAKRMKNSA